MNRSRAFFFGAAGIAAMWAFAACDTATYTTPIGVYVPPLPDASAGGDDSGGGGDDSGGGGDDSGGGGDASGGGGDDSGPIIGNDGGAITGNGCAAMNCANPMCKPLTTAAPIDMYPGLGFETQPNYIPKDTIILTLDDVPDGMNSPPDPVDGLGSWTKQDLSLLAQLGMHIDFFINTNNYCGDVTQDSECTQDILDILTLHNPANHTVNHVHLGLAPTAGSSPPDGCSTVADCTAQLTGVETVIDQLSNHGRPHLTRFRAPYGEPYQSGGPGSLTLVEPIVSKFAVTVGWNIDSTDSDGLPGHSGTQLAGVVEGLVGMTPGSGSWGILLMHGVHGFTHDAIPLLFGPTGSLTKRGFKTNATVEDAICWKYGKHSWEIVQQLTSQARGPN